MKPWEETWEFDGDNVYGTAKVACARVAVAREVSDEDGPLIAAAPEMARLLLELSSGVDTSDGEYRERCPVCEDRTMLPSDGRVGIPFDVHPGKHADDCQLVAVLRKAGVLP